MAVLHPSRLTTLNILRWRYIAKLQVGLVLRAFGPRCFCVSCLLPCVHALGLYQTAQLAINRRQVADLLVDAAPKPGIH